MFMKMFGPERIESMTQHIMLAWQADIDNRTNGLEHKDRTASPSKPMTPALVWSFRMKTSK
jgi:hypothetical protein